MLMQAASAKSVIREVLVIRRAIVMLLVRALHAMMQMLLPSAMFVLGAQLLVAGPIVERTVISAQMVRLAPNVLPSQMESTRTRIPLPIAKS